MLGRIKPDRGESRFCNGYRIWEIVPSVNAELQPLRYEELMPDELQEVKSAGSKPLDLSKASLRKT